MNRRHWHHNSLRVPALTEWIERFNADKWRAARGLRQERYAGMAEAVEQGFPEPWLA